MWGYGVKGGIAFLLRALFSGYLLRYDKCARGGTLLIYRQTLEVA